MDRFCLTDAQWAKMEPLCRGKPSDPGRSGGDNRVFVEAVLRIARNAPSAHPPEGRTAKPSHGSPWRDLPSVFVKGFGRRLAFESLRGTNPRAGSDQYGVLGVWLGWEHQPRAGVWPSTAGRSASEQARGIQCRCDTLAEVGCRRPFPRVAVAGHRRPQEACDFAIVHAVPGHGGLHAGEHVGRGGARGWAKRSKLSRISMRPPQHGQGWRWSDGSGSSSGSGVGGGAARRSRARARLSRRVPLASRP